MTESTSIDSKAVSSSSNSILKVSKKMVVWGSLAAMLGLLSVAGLGAAWFMSRYTVNDETPVQLKEFSSAEYPANPALLSQNFQRYTNRSLKVIKRDDTHFDFVLEPTNAKTAKIIIKNVDLSLMVPKVPEWTKQDQGTEIIALVDREWNRQQVGFPVNSKHIEIVGGDGFEKQNIQEIALANNCLNAGAWEVLLFVKEDGKKSLYYQGWFNFPTGQYKEIFEKINNISYWKHWWKLEHWQDPSGTEIQPNLLRQVIDQKEASINFSGDERIIAAGEQSRKIRTTLASNLTTWQDFYNKSDDIAFATFRLPGFYDTNVPWKNQYWRIGKFNGATLRNIQPTGLKQDIQEIELSFSDTKTGEQNKLLISGINFKELPKLPVDKYSDGLYMPLGIGVPPFYQSYEKLEKNHPDVSPYFGVLLDAKNRWIDHHRLALDGVTMHLDQNDSKLLHLYLLSYERNTLIAHFSINL